MRTRDLARLRLGVLCAALALARGAAGSDLNWAIGPPPDARPPEMPQPTPDRPPDDDCKTLGSIVNCQSQVLGEVVGLVGTPFALHYSSDRVPGNKGRNHLRIPLSGASVPASLVGITLDVMVAGQLFSQTFPPAPNQFTTFTWDGKDVYGRPVQGRVPATIRVGYVYTTAVYRMIFSIESTLAFGRVSGFTFENAGASRFPVTLYQVSQLQLGTLDARRLGTGGWALDAHHVYDPVSKTLFRGDGRQRDAVTVLGSRIVTTVAGIGNPGTYNGDGQPATSASLTEDGVAVASDGSVYIADFGNCRLRLVGTDGIIHTVAGTGLSNGSACDLTTGGNGDGGPATAAKVEPRDVALGPDGSVYFTELRDLRVRRIAPDGIMTTFAGNGTLPAFSAAGSNGDDGPATQASINPRAIAVAPDGSVYIADVVVNPNDGRSTVYRVRRVGTDGIISNFAGGALVAQFGGDGGPATQATFTNVSSVAVAPDGSLVIGSNADGRVRRVGTDGIITTVAGNGDVLDSGDGGPATQAGLQGAGVVTVAPDGTIYVATNARIRRVASDGIISTIAGTGRAGSFEDNAPATLTALGPQRMAVYPDGSLCLSDIMFGRVRRITSALPSLGSQEVLMASDDGDELFVFTAEGLHLRTLNALTGTIRYLFGYDADGRLIKVTDGDGNVTSVVRDGSGNATAFVAPGGQRTTLALDGNGYLSSITDPAGGTAQMAYTSDGLLVSRTDPRGSLFRYAYEALGRLVQDTEPTGGVKTLARLETATGYVVTLTTPLGRATTYQVDILGDGSIKRINSDTSGAQTVVITKPDGSQTATLPDGSTLALVVGPDPRFGMMLPRLRSRKRTLPGGQVESITGTHSATLSDPANLLTLATQTDTLTINGRAFTRSYDDPTKTITDTSAEGRQSSFTLDAQARVVKSVMGAGVTPVTMTYDAQGRLTEQRQGTRFWSFSYDPRNRMVSRADAASRTFTFGYDDADRVVSKMLPSGAAHGFSYDSSGNLTAIVLPSGARHQLGYTSLDQYASYTPPGNGSYTRAYDLDRQLTTTTLPGGRVKSQSYDATGRVLTLGDADAVTTFSYLPNDPTERAGAIGNAPASGANQNINLGYDGPLVTATTATGAAPSQATYTLDNNLFLSQLTLTSGQDSFQAVVTYDRDGLLTRFGPFTFAHAGPGGATSQVTDGIATATLTYDGFARVLSRSHQVAAQSVYALQLTYDVVGRVTTKTETLAGATHTSSYSYSLDGQLVGVTRDGTSTESYGYDLNGNRVSRLIGGSIESASYDAQDRLLRRGNTLYLFDADGFLSQRGSDTFQYNARGQLIEALVAGQPISYGYDGLGRRITRTDGAGTAQYFYGDIARSQLTAMRSAAGDFTTFHYDAEGLLIAVDRGGSRYHVACDQLGSPRVVSDANGAVVKTVEYDAFGDLVADSNPAFALEIGFAGGLQDPTSGLVHFGARDYDPAAGRWTARDPALFDGGQGNLYVYVGDDPVNGTDPTGLFCVTAVGYDGVGGGVQTCITGDGASVCAEVGFGFGVTVGVDNGGLEKSGTKDGIDVSAKCGDVGVGAEATLDDTGCLKYGPTASSGPIKVKKGPKGQVKADVDGAPKVKLSTKCSASGKVYGKVCTQGKF